jgi:hypothetical protein
MEAAEMILRIDHHLWLCLLRPLLEVGMQEQGQLAVMMRTGSQEMKY